MRSLFDCWEAFKGAYPPTDNRARVVIGRACTDTAEHEKVVRRFRYLEAKYGVKKDAYSRVTVAFGAHVNCRKWFGDAAFLSMIRIHFLEYARAVCLGVFQFGIQYNPSEKRIIEVIDRLRVEKRLFINYLDCVISYPLAIVRMATEEAGFTDPAARRALRTLAQKLSFSAVFESDNEASVLKIANVNEISCAVDADEGLFVKNLVDYATEKRIIFSVDREFMLKLLELVVATVDTDDEPRRWKKASELLGIKPKTLEKKFSRFSEKLQNQMESDGISPKSFFDKLYLRGVK